MSGHIKGRMQCSCQEVKKKRVSLPISTYKSSSKGMKTFFSTPKTSTWSEP